LTIHEKNNCREDKNKLLTLAQATGQKLTNICAQLPWGKKANMKMSQWGEEVQA
jgi:hypothetical protein